MITCRHLLHAAPVAIAAAACLAQPQFTPLGRAGFGNSYATAISADGLVVAGFFDPGPEAFVWTASTGITVIPALPDCWSTVPYAVSSNGVVSGEGRTIAGQRAFRWASASGMQDLNALVPNASAHAWAMSDDGQVIVGSSGTGSGIHAFRWTTGGGMVDLGIPESYALALTPDGSVMAGNFDPSPGAGTNLFRLSQSGAIEDLLTVGTNDTYPYAISADGNLIIGTTYETELFRAVRWTPSTGLQLLDLPELSISASAQDTSDDGNLIVGFWIDYSYEARGAIWTPDGAMDLHAYLLGRGVTGLDGWEIHNGLGVSGDGSTIVGTGRHDGYEEAFIVTGLGASPCAACAADYDQDGGVTAGDIGAFFVDWESGAPCADVDQDGGITGGDIGAFFTVFEAGGC